MSREQLQGLDEALRKAPQPFGPVPVEKMREGFAAFMGSFSVPAGVRSVSAELAGRPVPPTTTASSSSSRSRT